MKNQEETRAMALEITEWIADNGNEDYIPLAVRDRLTKLAAISCASFPSPDILKQMIMMKQFVNAIFNLGYETAKMETSKEVGH